MDEQEVMQQEAEVEQTEPEVEVDPWDDDWSDLETETFSSDEEEPSPETDEPEAEELPAENTVPEQEETPAPEVQSEPQRFKLTHLGKEQEVTLEEITALAQKGLNYDHTKGKLDNLADFMKKMAAGNGQTVDEFMALTAARMLMAEESKNGNRISETDAILRVSKEMKGIDLGFEEQKKEPEPQNEADTVKDVMIKRFMDAYPGVKGDEIPQEVWDEGFRTGDLAGAYGRYENRQLRKEIETLKQNEKNRARSTGSRKSAGAPKGKDAFDALWYDGT